MIEDPNYMPEVVQVIATPVRDYQIILTSTMARSASSTWPPCWTVPCFNRSRMWSCSGAAAGVRRLGYLNHRVITSRLRGIAVAYLTQ